MGKSLLALKPCTKVYTMKRDEVIATLREHEPDLRSAGIVRLSLFGSVARDEAQAESDIDLLAAFDSSRALSLLDVIGIENRLADLLGQPVDLIEEGTLRPRARLSAGREAVRAF
jgi:predicted nucleotidyltransferase